ncbi:MAG: hypothetical protein HRU11_08110 [Parvularculaceae bacterium]|nr:hypothetical protein [Parvularculaceae bacterium]
MCQSRGGTGGTGGSGGNGGGTIRVIGSLIEYDGAFFDLSGGDGATGNGVAAGGDGEIGRFVALYNTQEISGLSFIARTSVSGVNGPKEANPYTKGGIETPTLPDLEGRANTFGTFQAFDASDPAFAALLLGIPDGALIGLTRVDDTTMFFGQDFSGYDLLVLSNLTGEDQAGVSFGYDFDGLAEGFFYPGSDDGLLAGLELFLTLIPETLGTVSLQTAFGTIAGQVLADGQSFFQTAAPVPVPGAIPLMASGLALAAWRQRRRSARTPLLCPRTPGILPSGKRAEHAVYPWFDGKRAGAGRGER